MITSASKCSPDFSWIPFSVKVSMWSVTTEPLPCFNTLKRSPFGTAHRRSSQGLYSGVKCFISTLLPTCTCTCFCNRLRMSFGCALLRLRSEEHTSELQSRFDLVCRLLLEKKKT